MILRTVRGKTPQIDPSCFIAENAVLVGDLVLGRRSSVWYNVTLRADVASIRIGDESNIQDGTVVHGTFEKYATTIGHRVTVGHMVMLHGCRIGDGCLIGMGSVIMDGALVGENSLVGAGSLITEGKIFPPRSLILGRPARRVRELNEGELRGLEESADHYLLYSSWYRPVTAEPPT
ncbi:MAG: gamma carbonic anhydrase family protein [Bdellovibrio sp.]|nr:MAG: gamma carbonic anhydrase family protein [Bdellovibrio sp.]